MDQLFIKTELRMEKMTGKGAWHYVIIPRSLVNPDVPKGWIRVKGLIDNYEISKYNLFSMKNGNLFLAVKSEIRKITGKQEGDYISVELYMDNDPLEIPDELMICLKDDPYVYHTFMALKEGEKKSYIDWINEAKRDETKVSRISTTLRKVASGLKFTDKE